jgi:adenylate cyclase class 2
MIEVEVKARLRSFDDVRENMAKLGVWLEGTATQIDTQFGHEKFLDSEHKIIEGGILARIRQEGSKKILEFKEINRKEGAIELKFEITDIDLAKEFLKKLGFEEAFKIEKSREKYGYKNFIINLDNVTGLGKFIEIEIIVAEPKEKDKAMKECLDLLNFLLPNVQIENKKYGDIMQELINQGKN